MKFTLRVTVLSVLLVLVVATVAGLGWNSYRNARFTADDLSAQVLDQASLRVDHQMNDLLITANEQAALNQRLVQSGQYDVREFPRLAAYWLEVMKVHPKLTRLTFAAETGEWSYVRRIRNGGLVIGELRRNARTHKLELRDYWPEEYPRRPVYENLDKDADDPRKQPWYIAARAARRAVWSEAYIFVDAGKDTEVPGVTHAVPVLREDGSLLGVLTASFDLYELCLYLKTLTVGRNGYAFAVEFRTDGTRRVIAHPDPEILLPPVQEAGEGAARELVPVEMLADRHVAAFLKEVPDGLTPTELQGMGRIQFTLDGVPYVGGYRCLSTQDTPNWLICFFLPEVDVLEQVERNNRHTIFIGLAVFTVAVLVSVWVAAKIAWPLERLARDVQAVGRLRFEASPAVHSPILEVDHLAQATEEMKAGLRSFQKYVPADLVRALLAAGEEARLGGENRTVTIFFCDIANFTSISEALTPAQLLEHLGDYLKALSAEILATGGTVDKYIGDAIMAFWGAPLLNPGHALAACTAAVRCQEKLRTLRARWKAEGKPLFCTRMGVHSGDVVVGNIGSEARMNYTIIGDAVNLASRLEGLNKYYGTDTLISESTYQQVKEAVVARPLDWVSVKGKTEAVLVYELIGLKGEVDPDKQELASLYAEALGSYRSQEWRRAVELFDEVLRFCADDGPARLLLARCRSYQNNPPGHDWDGVHRMDSK